MNMLLTSPGINMTLLVYFEEMILGNNRFIISLGLLPVLDTNTLMMAIKTIIDGPQRINKARQ
jgi:hypothetical protein